MAENENEQTEVPAPQQAPGGDRAANAQGSASEKAGSESKETLTFTGGQVAAEQLTVANEVTQQITHYHMSSGSESEGVSRLSLEHFEVFEVEHLRHLKSKLRFTPAQFEPLIGVLEEHRFLILLGEPLLGKRSLALALAARLRGERTALLCRSVERNLRIDLKVLVGEESSYRGRVVVFENAFAAQNTDLLRFVRQFATERTSYTRRLEGNDTYLVFTSTELPESEQALTAHGFLKSAPTPPVDLLTEELEARVRELAIQPSLRGDAAQQAIRQFEEENALPAMAAKLRTFPRLASFVAEYLPRIALGELTLEEGLAQVDNLERWLWVDLPQEPGAWSLALSLTLCSAAPLAQSVPWIQLERFRHALARALSRELQRLRQEREIKELCQGQWTLERARAEVVPVPYPEADAVKFRDASYGERLWQSLLRQGQMLAVLIPLLRKWTAEEEPYLRQSAARALGRIGQLDPPYVVYPLIFEWIDSDKPSLLGGLYQGILSAGDASYAKGCLGRLRQALQSPNSETAATALVSLRQVAILDLDFALGELRRLALARLEPRWQELRELEELLRAVEEVSRSRVRPQDSDREAKEFRRNAQALLVARLVPEKDLRLLGAFQFTLAGLLLHVPDETTVVGRLVEWMRCDRERLGPLVALLFLHEGGIAERLERSGAAKSAAVPRSNPLLRSAQESPEAAVLLKDLLEELFVNLRPFPGLLYSILEGRYQALLAGWAKEAGEDERQRATVAELIRGLFASRHRELSGWVLRLAQRGSTSDESSALRDLTVEAITRRRAPATAETAAA